MLREMPSRRWKSSNRVTPRKQSRTMSMVHHSPTTSRVWATEQFMPSKLFRRMAPLYWVAWCNALQGRGRCTYQRAFQSSGASHPSGPSSAGRGTRTASESIQVGWSKPACFQCRRGTDFQSRLLMPPSE